MKTYIDELMKEIRTKQSERNNSNDLVQELLKRSDQKREKTPSSLASEIQQ